MSLIKNVLFTDLNVICVIHIIHIIHIIFGYTPRHPHQRIKEHRTPAIGKVWRPAIG